MKKFTFLALGLAAATCAFAQDDDYVLVEIGSGAQYYEYWGDDMLDTLDVDFTTWNYDSIPDPGLSESVTAGHSDMIIERAKLGFYKYTIYENRPIDMNGTATATNALFNGGYTLFNGVKTSNALIENSKRPAIYFPHYPYGIDKIIVTGVSNKTARTMFWSYRYVGVDTQGNDSIYFAGLPNMNFGNTYDEYVEEINSEMVTDVHTSRNSTEYWFITRLQVIPMPVPKAALEKIKASTFTCRSVANGILIHASETSNVTIYSLTGAVLHQVTVYGGEREFVAMPAGFYLVNNQKVVVR
jgi:hypothetical protein